MTAPAETGGGPPALWDPIVRLTHWGLALVVLLNAAVTGEGDTAHVWVGYVGLALMAVRLVWGIVGPAEARFSAFPPSPRAALAHLADLAWGRPRAYPSHNPAGAMMAYALWAALAVTIGTGIAITGTGPGARADHDAAFARGDWSVLAHERPFVDDETGELLEDVHEMAANLVLVLVLIHVAGVALESRALGRNLLRPMLAGRRTPAGKP